MLSASTSGHHLLRVQVYNYLEQQMRLGNLEPGSLISVNTIIKELGVSRTPLREALLLLQEQGFVTIQPQRGVKINALTMDDVKYIYEILGGIESRIILSVFDNLRENEIGQMKALNDEIELALANGDIVSHNWANINFHGVFLGLSGNQRMLRYVKNLKMQLYDFPRRDFEKKWNANNVHQHRNFVQLIEEGLALAAADYLRDIHWDFDPPDSFQIISG